MKLVCQSGADRITDLPAEVIQHILVLLPIKDAAKTSVLSRNWRHQWRSIPRLVFDDEFADIAVAAESEWKEMTKQVMLNIYQCLLLHDGPITKFMLSIPGFLPCHEIDLLTLYLSNKGVQHFTLQFRCVNDEEEEEEDDNDDDDDDVDADVDYYQMHSSLFSALHLKYLELQCLEFTLPSWFVGFSKLTYLRLEEVILPYDFFENFLPKCLMLESLAFHCCTGHADKLDIEAPFLKSFYFWGSLDICFKSTPLLSDVLLYITDGGIPDMESLFASLPALQRFHINYEILKYLAAGDRNVPTRLLTPLHRLEDLDVRFPVFDGSRMERVFVCLIMSSPNLRKLTILVSKSQLDVEGSNDEVSSIRRLLEAEVCPRSSDCLQHLTEFRLKFIRGAQAELDLMRFVLATAPLLRLICILLDLEKKEAMEFMKEVMQYSRVSKEAEITSHWKH